MTVVYFDKAVACDCALTHFSGEGGEQADHWHRGWCRDWSGSLSAGHLHRLHLRQKNQVGWNSHCKKELEIKCGKKE